MASSGSSSTSSGPVATGSRRRRLVLRLSQKDALQALFQQNPYPGIATRERLARELGIAESRVQVWFQNQRRRRFKQSRSPPEHVHPEGEAGRRPRPHHRRARLDLSLPLQGPRDAFAENGPAGAALGLTDQRPGGQAGCRMGAAQAPARYGFQNRRARHPQQSPSGPGGAAATTPPAPEDRRTPPSESMPPSAAPAAPFGAPAFWVPGTAPGVCVGQPLMIFLVQPSPGALRPSSPSVQVALLASLGIPGSPGPFPGSSPVVAGAHPAFPGSPSLLEEILAATATRDTPWSPPGPPAWDEGVEATLEAPPQ
nr:double homeobox protein 4C-like [Ovis aries]